MRTGSVKVESRIYFCSTMPAYTSRVRGVNITWIQVSPRALAHGLSHTNKQTYIEPQPYTLVRDAPYSNKNGRICSDQTSLKLYTVLPAACDVSRTNTRTSAARPTTCSSDEPSPPRGHDPTGWHASYQAREIRRRRGSDLVRVATDGKTTVVTTRLTMNYSTAGKSIRL